MTTSSSMTGAAASFHQVKSGLPSLITQEQSTSAEKASKGRPVKRLESMAAGKCGGGEMRARLPVD
jgi:hypothetical protein